MPQRFRSEPQGRIEKIKCYLRSLPGLLAYNRYQDLEAYLMFIGYPRSGHSLLGSLLDAHPDMVIAHELDALYYFKARYHAYQIYHLILEKAYQFTAEGRQWMGYDYNVPGQWHGRYRKLKVIGDKSGGRSSRRMKRPKGPNHLQKVIRYTGKKVKIIHMVRNPFDNISTMTTRSAERVGWALDRENLDQQIRAYFRLAETNKKIIDLGIHDIYTIHQEAFIADPTTELRKILEWLELDASDDYLAACDKVVWNNPKKRRFSFPLWNEATKTIVQEHMRNISFLSNYTYD
ncbi:MAG: sulfotransferase [Bacteroidota bacterium]